MISTYSLNRLLGRRASLIPRRTVISEDGQGATVVDGEPVRIMARWLSRDVAEEITGQVLKEEQGLLRVHGADSVGSADHVEIDGDRWEIVKWQPIRRDGFVLTVQRTAS